MHKILQSCFSRSWGGLEMQALSECNELIRRGHEVTLLCPSASRLEKEAKDSQIETFPIQLRWSDFPAALWHLRKFLRTRHMDIVHCQLSGDLSFLVPVTRAIPDPPRVVLTKRVGSYVRKKDLFHRWLYRHTSLVIAISQVIRKNVLETCPIDESRVETLFDGVDLEQFSRSRVDRGAFRKEFGIMDSMIVIGMVGRFSPGKGHEEFLQAAEIVHSHFPESKFLIVGEPTFGEKEYGERIVRMAESLVRAGVVLFTGFRKDIPQIMAGMDILAFPSHAEAFGDVLIEAMAMELPVVSTNCDGVLDIVVHEETGLHVPPRNAAALAEGVIRLIRDDSVRRRFGQAGRKRVEKFFDLRTRTDRMEELYNRVLHAEM